EPLEEVGLAERLAVEQLEADAAAFRKPAARERETELVEPLGRDEDRAPTVLEPEGDLLRAERIDDRGGVLLAEIREQRTVERPLHPPREREHREERPEPDARDRDAPRRRLRDEE